MDECLCEKLQRHLFDLMVKDSNKRFKQIEDALLQNFDLDKENTGRVADLEQKTEYISEVLLEQREKQRLIPELRSYCDELFRTTKGLKQEVSSKNYEVKDFSDRLRLTEDQFSSLQLYF